MTRYLTVQQYKNADDGLPLADLNDLVLARFVSRAESDLDSFMGFDLYLGGFEPHIVTVQQPWDEKRLRTLAPNHPVPVRQVTRYRIQVSNISTSGAGFFANIHPGDAVVNVTQGYIEIVPLQALTYSLSPVILQLALKPPIVQADIEVGWFLSVFGEVFINDGDNLVYRALRGFWAVQESQYTQALASQPQILPPIPPVLFANGIQLSPGIYTIDAQEGAVTFLTPRTSTDVITGNYCYQIPDPIRDATILQTTHLLGQRALNKQGMQGVETVRSGKQSVKRSVHPDGGTKALCDEAAAKLMAYMTIPVG